MAVASFMDTIQQATCVGGICDHVLCHEMATSTQQHDQPNGTESFNLSLITQDSNEQAMREPVNNGTKMLQLEPVHGPMMDSLFS